MALTYPLTGPATLQRVIPAYLYTQYNDDDTLQAFWGAFNTLAQGYVDTFNSLNLPIYTGPVVQGALLDWVGNGLYGIARPTLASSTALSIGPLDTWTLDFIPLDSPETTTTSMFVTLNDDFYRRVLTWHLYLGDGLQFDILWLKRRIARFLYGLNGTDLGTADTSAISVTIAASHVTVTIAATQDTVTAANLLALAIASNVLETPFELTFTVNVTGP